MALSMSIISPSPPLLLYRHEVIRMIGTVLVLTGGSLAYATLHLTVAHLFRRFEIETTGYTTDYDMDWNDRFVPVPNGRIKGLVKIRKD